MSVWLTPKELKPVFGGTYFPSKDSYGMPAFSTVLKQISQVKSHIYKYELFPIDSQRFGRTIFRYLYLIIYFCCTIIIF